MMMICGVEHKLFRLGEWNVCVKASLAFYGIVDLRILDWEFCFAVNPTG
jgi:hypothetical protein